jgi:hypothetical protein
MRGVKDKIEPGFRCGTLSVIREVPWSTKDKRRRVEVRCDCGVIKDTYWKFIKEQKSKSCGCLSLGERSSVEPPTVQGARWIPVTQNQWALVDDDMYEAVSARKWSLVTGGYASNRLNYVSIRLHHFVFGHPPTGMQVDHINRNALDNRRCNLRLATPSQNCQNKRPGIGRKSKGLRQYECGWMARIRTPDGRICLGTFKTEVEAARAYNEAAKRLHGEFAWLNPIPDEVD